MAIEFHDVNSAAGLKKLDDYLFTRSYISGFQASKDDITVYVALSKPPSSEFVNLSRWYNHISALLLLSGVCRESSGVVVHGSAPVTQDAIATSPVANTTEIEEEDDVLDRYPGILVEEGPESASKAEEIIIPINDTAEEAPLEYRSRFTVTSLAIGLVIPLMVGGGSVLSRKAKDMKYSVALLYKNTVASLLLLLITLMTKRAWPVWNKTLYIRISLLVVLGVLDETLSSAGGGLVPAFLVAVLTSCVPGLTFIGSCLCRMESITIHDWRGQAKLLGLLVMIGGALLIAFISGPTISVRSWSSSDISQDWVAGPILLLISVFSSASYSILMEKTIEVDPEINELSLATMIWIPRTVFHMLLAIFLPNRLPSVWVIEYSFRTFYYLYAGVISTFAVALLQIKLIADCGAVFMSSFSPISMIFITVMGAVVYHDHMGVGSVVGVIAVFLGLGVLHWGKWETPEIKV